MKKKYYLPAFLVLKMGNGREKQADSEGGKTKMNRNEDVTNYITECDKEVGEALALELGRQRRNLELIASENIVSPAVMLAMGTVPANKYAEGYPVSRQWISQKVCWTMVFIRLQCISH